MVALTRSRLILFLLPLAVFLVYGQSLSNGFVLWDDDKLITENPIVRSLSPHTVRAAFTSYDPELYVPFTIVSYQVEHALFGFQPAVFHGTSLILHIIAAFLVYAFLRKVGVKAALPCALLFAVHPLNVEAVAWASARKDVLSAVFALASLLSYLRYRQGGGRPAFWSAFLCLLLSLLAKPAAIVLPFAYLLLDWKEGGGRGRDAWREKIPFFLLSAVFLLIGLAGKEANVQALPPVHTALLAAKSAVLSPSLFLFPRFSLLFLQHTPVTPRSPEFFLPLLLLAALGGLTLRSLRRTRSLAFGLGFALLFLLPSFVTFSKAGAVYVTSDRYMYLAQVGFLFLLGLALDRFLSSRALRAATIAAVTVTLLAAGWGAWRRSLLWNNSATLLQAALARNPGSAALPHNLGELAAGEGDTEGAILRYREALRADPAYAPSFIGLGRIAQAQGEADRALRLFRSAIQADPRSVNAYLHLGNLYRDRGDVDGAIAAFRRALEIKPNFAQARINLADAYGKKGMYREGLLEYKRVMEINPEFRKEILQKFPQLEQLDMGE
ncbi:MAG: tetratricopeptide repeat protein [Candidatus Peribacteraceae bacterium]